MPKFIYIATNSQNKSITGTLEASDKSAVISALSKQGLRPISIKEGGGGKKGNIELGGFFSSKKVKSDDLVMFTRQLSAMVSAGVPLLRALNSLHQHTESDGLK
ncbi:MAG TPA: type II secretion system F family protein, partial [Candidatus Saccharimonadales bacterium]